MKILNMAGQLALAAGEDAMDVSVVFPRGHRRQQARTRRLGDTYPWMPVEPPVCRRVLTSSARSRPTPSVPSCVGPSGSGRK